MSAESRYETNGPERAWRSVLWQETRGQVRQTACTGVVPNFVGYMMCSEAGERCALRSSGGELLLSRNRSRVRILVHDDRFC